MYGAAQRPARIARPPDDRPISGSEPCDMELLPLLGALAVLALVDSTSFGTLLIPVWLLMTPGRVRVARMLVYLATIVGFYLAVGLVIALGAGAFADVLGQVVETRPVRIVELLLGVGLVAYSFRIDRRSKGASTGQGRVLRWRARAMGTSGGEGVAPSGLGPCPTAERTPCARPRPARASTPRRRRDP